jgi:AcrR family transcriptional regulator
MKIILDEKKARTKLPQVMRAAVHLFVRKGIDGTTIKDIAREASVAEGALYRHFKSKDDLAWYLFQSQLSQFTTDLVAKVFAQARARERVSVFVAESFNAYEEDRDLFTYLILREHTELAKYASTAAHPGTVALKIIEEGQQQGEIRPGEPLILGSLFVGSVIRVCVVRMYGNLTSDLRKHAGEVARGIWEMLKESSKQAS